MTCSKYLSMFYNTAAKCRAWDDSPIDHIDDVTKLCKKPVKLE